MVQMSKFRAALLEAREDEALLDRLFRPEYNINPLTKEAEKAGLGDRVFIKNDDPGGIAQLIEYKCDRRIEGTDNLFIEIASVEIDGTIEKLGWAHTCKADKLFYFLPERLFVLVFKPQDIRDNLTRWGQIFPVGTTRDELNDGYNATGILVPLPVALKLAIETRDFNHGPSIAPRPKSPQKHKKIPF